MLIDDVLNRWDEIEARTAPRDVQEHADLIDRLIDEGVRQISLEPDVERKKKIGKNAVAFLSYFPVTISKSDQLLEGSPLIRFISAVGLRNASDLLVIHEETKEQIRLVYELFGRTPRGKATYTEFFDAIRKFKDKNPYTIIKVEF